MTRHLYTVYLRNDVTDETLEIEVTAASQQEALEIAASRNNWEWVIDRIEQIP